LTTVNTKLVGFYSFPKSGKTWLSKIIAHVFFEGNLDAIADVYRQSPLNAIEVNSGSLSLKFYNSHSTKLWGRDLSHNEHDIFDLHQTIVYTVRHPLDVFLSSLNYIGNVENLSSYFISGRSKSAEEIFVDGELEYYFHTFLCNCTLQPDFYDASRWDFNVTEWFNFDSKNINKFFIKYEDLYINTFETLRPIFSGLNVSDDKLAQAIEIVAYEGKPDGKFIWKKNINYYKDFLNQSQIDLFYKYYKAALTRAGYL
jgi:hypothetical protein